MKGNCLYKKITTIILVLSFVMPAAFLMTPNKTHAQGALDLIGGPSNIIAAGFAAMSAAFDAISSVAISSLVLKEYVLDGLASLIKEMLIKSITASIVNWINGGFEGEPSFITDLEGFMLDVADQVVGRYIEGSELAFLCSPFRINVRISIALDYYSTTRDRFACTLTGALQNIEDAFDDFSSGNAWDQWFQLSINPSNNAYGAFLGSRQAMRRDIARAQSIESQKLNWGNGFQSYEVCDSPETGDNTAPNLSANIGNIKINCRIATPGIIINEQLSHVLGSGFRQLELADEINEIIGALLGQLVKQVLGGSEGGLSGLSRSNYGRPSYISQLLQEKANTSGVSEKTLEIIQNDLQNESKYRRAKQSSLDAIMVAREKVETLQQCYLGKASQNRILWGIVGDGNDKRVVSFTPNELINKANTASSTITDSLLPIQNRLTADIDQSDITVVRLIIIKTDIKNSKSVEELNSAINEYQELQKSGSLKTTRDIFDAELERDGYPGERTSLAKGIIRDMATFNNQTKSDLNVCQSLVLTQPPIISFNGN